MRGWIKTQKPADQAKLEADLLPIKNTAGDVYKVGKKEISFKIQQNEDKCALSNGTPLTGYLTERANEVEKQAAFDKNADDLNDAPVKKPSAEAQPESELDVQKEQFNKLTKDLEESRREVEKIIRINSYSS